MTSGPAPLCQKCKHLDRENQRGLICPAYPEGVPDEIIFSKWDHRLPAPRDRGVRFEIIPGETLTELDLWAFQDQ